MNPINSVSEFLKGIEKGRILVALSGGGDSVCLLSVLKELGTDICAFHLNHCIRGAEADRDEAFCRDLCGKLDVPFYTEKADIPALSKECGKGLEETARVVRYQLLEEIADTAKCRYIATAHNGDDNAETVIFNLVRGCSPDGLGGIPAVRGRIIRPLLNASRAEIDEYLGARQILYVTDSTNFDESYTRNKIRHSVMPVLRSINPSVVTSVSRLCESVKNDKSYFEDALSDRRNELPADLPISLLTRQISKRYEAKTGLSLDFAHINKIAGSVKNRVCTTLDLPGKVCVYIYYGDYSFEKRTVCSEYCVPVQQGITEIPQKSTKIFYGNENVYKLATSVTVDCGKIVGSLYARPRMEGDRIKVFGVSKSVRKEFINKKIPLCVRNDIPVICDDEGIVYVPYIGADDRVFSNSGRHILGLLC
ncbi:MAG: tRNA lysidine(34) synthetase TilS [Clostridia bacterium]|nr:tRNA lysidine(34) synthetase TilS [Clostridia bacterium]